MKANVVPLRDVSPADATSSTGDGSVDAEPCYGCPCCASWASALEQLRASAVTHNARTPRGYPCSDECLVCRVAEWSR